MKEFKELSSYKNRGNSYIFIPYIVKPIKRVYKLLPIFVPNEPCPESPHGYQSFITNGYHQYFAQPKIPRNSLCPCNSGKKYKKCCLT